MKSIICGTTTGITRSLPSWERGLKCYISVTFRNVRGVAPLVGAWIEMNPITEEETGTRRRSPRGSVD